MNERKKIPVLITTDKDKRGVFFGYINPEDLQNDNLEAEGVQMCVYWSTNVRGVLGLAANGPDKASRITAPVKGTALIKGVTFVAECSAKAVKAWKAQPWG